MMHHIFTCKMVVSPNIHYEFVLLTLFQTSNFTKVKFIPQMAPFVTVHMPRTQLLTGSFHCQRSFSSFDPGSPTCRPKQKVAASGWGFFRMDAWSKGFFHPTNGAKVWSLMICEAKKNVQPRRRFKGRIVRIAP